ncbi:MAG: hypothetical protein JST80_06170 [Bdellovibrionales bacterium]|nr:hypothetical protein [Bdellovibrionales bacterium]
MKKPSLYPIFFGLAVLFTVQTSFALPTCCTDPCGSSEIGGCCAKAEDRAECREEPKPAPTAEPASTKGPDQPTGGSHFGNYTIIQENGVYKAVQQ